MIIFSDETHIYRPIMVIDESQDSKRLKRETVLSKVIIIWRGMSLGSKTPLVILQG